MNRKLILLNIALLALAGWVGYLLRQKWIEMHAHERRVLGMRAIAKDAIRYPPAPPLQPVVAATYVEVAQKDLFAKDRNPVIPIEPPPAPPPKPKMPDLPSYYGLMNFGDPVIYLSLPRQAQKQYHAGDKVGDFKLVSFDRDKVTFEWNGEIVERKPEELKPKESEQAQVQVVAAPQVAAVPVSSGPNSKSISGSSDSSSSNTNPKLGPENGDVRQCVAGDKSPAGTVLDGYKKVLLPSMFGDPTCMWKRVDQ